MIRACAVALLLLTPRLASAHFLELIPSSDLVSGGTVTLDMAFLHPMERGPVLDMAEPDSIGVMRSGTVTDLRPALQAREVAGTRSWRVDYNLTRPGGYVFFVVPQPYWERSEAKLAIHYAKVVVDFASGLDWDALVGLPVEIQPLSRPYGLWVGNLFQGVALKDGRPLPDAVVEVEWRNDGSLTPPSDAFVTQVVKTDSQGVFAYAMPRAGWWGFNVITDSGRTMPSPEGEPLPVELNGAMWVHAVTMK